MEVCNCVYVSRRSSLCRRRGRRGKAEEEPRNGTEKLSMMDSGVTHTHLTSDAAEHTDAVWEECVCARVCPTDWELFRILSDSCCLLSHTDGNVLRNVPQCWAGMWPAEPERHFHRESLSGCATSWGTRCSLSLLHETPNKVQDKEEGPSGLNAED